MFPNEAFVESIKKQYPAGSRIQLIEMADDPRPIPSGTKGTVRLVDDAAQIHVDWDNGRSLAVIPGTDSFHKIADRNRSDRDAR